MSAQQAEGWTRRRFLGGLTVAGMVGCLGLTPRWVAAAPPPETTTIKLLQNPGICFAPQFVAEALLQAEGFTEVHFVPATGGVAGAQALAAGQAHFSTQTAGLLITRIDAGDPIVFLAGLHVGCFELFGTERVRAIHDLKGKRVAVTDLGSGRHVFLAVMAAYVGLDPRQDIQWVTPPAAEAMQLFAAGQVDAFMAFPPEPQALRRQQIGHVVVNTTLDRPWEQYFCCMVTGNQAFVRKYPVATKRAVRAILKATDMCALEPDRAAQLIVEKGVTPRYDYALQTMQEIPYKRWREYDPEDTVRFFALRLHEVGMIKSTPQKLIAQGTDWRFLNELKRELKG
jgi:NitT/TauT family transport system substrate-binding protein